MPKIIKDAKELILQKTKALLLEKGLEAINMRTVAREAGIASGTLYNYVSSKEMLINEVLLADWNEMILQIGTLISSAKSALGGTEAVFDAIRVFTAPYQPILHSLRIKNFYINLRMEQHKTMIDQLSEQLLVLAERFDFHYDPTVCPFLSEVLLSGAMYPNGDFKYLAPCIARIVGENI